MLEKKKKVLLELLYIPLSQKVSETPSIRNVIYKESLKSAFTLLLGVIIQDYFLLPILRDVCV